MTGRINLTDALPPAFRQLQELRDTAEQAARDAGLDQKLVELVQIRASQLNGCAFCVDKHVRQALEAGEEQRRLHLLAAWWETELYTDQERAALLLTEALSKLSQTQDVSDEVYTEVTAVLSKKQYVAVAWTVSVANTFNRLAVASRKRLPRLRQEGTP
ncbi:carboxymuconolactone decarboxylase family protein [Actinokineospora enzanensis]|uniref:carboxymuconolactone decarboxylase family protein n=1 Tax=Actinokineospora enzanensis TaxID=155975 RepID=UPI00035C8D48|nr:carboxymuconolactone decarboxylase family protein [Actinokineospora enzanensis]